MKIVFATLLCRVLLL